MISEVRDKASGYLQCATIGMAAVIALYFSSSVTSVEPVFFAALLLYFSALVYRRFEHAFALFIFFIITLAFSHGEPTYSNVRVTLFALILSVSHGRRYGLSPVVMLGMLWELALLSPMLSFGYVVPPLDPSTVSTMLAEILGLLGLWFLASSPWIRSILPPASLMQKHHFVHIMMIPLFAVPAATLYLIHFWTGLTPNGLMVKYDLTRQPIIFGWLSLSLAGMLLAAVLANVILDMLDVYIRAATPLPLQPNEQLDSAFVDAKEVLYRLRYDAEELMALRRVFREIQGGLNVELPQVAATYRALEKSAEVLANVPDGCLAVMPGGQIVSASAGLERLLGLSAPLRPGDQIEDVSAGRSRFATDVLAVAEWATEHYEDLLKRGSRETLTQAVAGEYLEVTMKAWRFGAASNGKDRKGPVVIAIYLRLRKDRRDMQLQMLQPGEFERIGSAANELLQSLEEHIAGVNEPLALLATKFQNGVDTAGRPIGASSSGGEISQLLMEVLKVFRRFTTEIEDQGRSISALRSTVEKVDLGAALEQTTNYLLELLGSERRIRFGPSAKSDKEAPAEPPTAVTVQLPLAEIFGFLNYYTLFLRYVIPLARDFTLQLDYEQIGTRTASLLSGSIPGRYARLTLRHSGQSITSNVLSAQQDPSYVLNAESTESIGSALYFLTRQVKRLGGFASIQSSVAKGTDVTIYLPVEISSSSRPSKRELRRISATLASGTSKSADQVLVVSNDEKSAERLSGLLDDMALHPVVRKPTDLLGDLVTPVEFEGCGFGGDSNGGGIDLNGSSENGSAEPRQKIDFTSFSLLIFDSTMADFGTLSLIDELEKENPSVAKLLLLDQEDTERAQMLSSNWITVFKPVEDLALCEKIHDALKNAIRVQESLLVIQGNDSLRGSGFS